MRIYTINWTEPNPIEKLWANFKRNLRKVIKRFDDFLDAITFAMQITQSG